MILATSESEVALASSRGGGCWPNGAGSRTASFTLCAPGCCCELLPYVMTFDAVICSMKFSVSCCWSSLLLPSMNCDVVAIGFSLLNELCLFRLFEEFFSQCSVRKCFHRQLSVGAFELGGRGLVVDC